MIYPITQPAFICSKLAIGVVLMSLLLTLNIFHALFYSIVSIVNLEHVIAGWVNVSKKLHYLQEPSSTVGKTLSWKKKPWKSEFNFLVECLVDYSNTDLEL